MAAHPLIAAAALVIPWPKQEARLELLELTR